MRQVSSCNFRKLIILNTFFFKRVVIILVEIVGDGYLYIVKLLRNQVMRGCEQPLSLGCNPILFFSFVFLKIYLQASLHQRWQTMVLSLVVLFLFFFRQFRS